MTKYAELKLYFGLTDSDGCREVRFDKLGQDEYSIGLRSRACQLVNRALDAASEGREFPHLRVGYHPFVKDEKEARALYAHLQSKMPNVKLVFELEDCMHGMLRFHRYMHIEGLGTSDGDSLMRLIKDSKIVSRLASENPYPWMPEYAKIHEAQVWESASLTFHE